MNSLINDYVKLGKNVVIWHFCNIYGTQKEPVLIGQNTHIGSFGEIMPGVKIGKNCRIQVGVCISQGTTIEDTVFIGPRVIFLNDTYPTAYQAQMGIWKNTPATIQTGAVIGGGAIIGPGVTIGTYAVVGMGSVVTKSVAPYSVVCGNPVRVLGSVKDKKYRGRFIFK